MQVIIHLIQLGIALVVRVVSWICVKKQGGRLDIMKCEGGRLDIRIILGGRLDICRIKLHRTHLYDRLVSVKNQQYQVS
jgi:hypothetical protein